MGINDAKADFACAKWSHMSVSYELLPLLYNNDTVFYYILVQLLFSGFAR